MKTYHSNGNIWQHFFFRDGHIDGEYRVYYDDGQLCSHFFYKNGNDITKDVIKLVTNPSNLTNEEKAVIKLTFGIRCL